MNLILFDDHSWENLLPLTYTKPTAELRVGILKIREKWEKALGTKASHQTKDYLSDKFPVVSESENLLINGALLPDKDLLYAIAGLKRDQALKSGDTLLIAKTGSIGGEITPEKLLEKADEYPQHIEMIDHPWKIFSLNGTGN